jgi:hypothetical protein
MEIGLTATSRQNPSLWTAWGSHVWKMEAWNTELVKRHMTIWLYNHVSCKAWANQRISRFRFRKKKHSPNAHNLLLHNFRFKVFTTEGSHEMFIKLTNERQFCLDAYASSRLVNRQPLRTQVVDIQSNLIQKVAFIIHTHPLRRR